MNKEIQLNGHKVEICDSGSGSIDPWTGKKADELGVSLVGTSDMASFMRVDEETIYKLPHYGYPVYELISNGTISSYSDLLSWCDKNIRENDKFSYSKSVADLLRIKRRKDMQERQMTEVKQVIVVRKDLGMRKGKLVAQGSHASLGSLLKFFTKRERYGGSIEYSTLFKPGSALDKWLNGIFTKICVYVNSEQELLDLDKKCEELEIPHALITDAGLTEFHGVPTITCLGIGPWDSGEIDKITGNLPLL